MELNWSTFILEIINFLVLVWILKRFLYRPVLDVIARRREAIEQQSSESQQLRQEAETLKNQYQNRLADWEQERRQARETLTREMDQEQARQMEALQASLGREREKMQAAEECRQAEKTREIEHQALQQGAEFATRLLAMASGPELEKRLVDRVIGELAELSPQQSARLQAQWGEHPEQIALQSAYPLAAEQQQALEKQLAATVGKAIPVDYSRQPELLAGLQITIGAWVLQANIRDELRGFTEFARAVR